MTRMRALAIVAVATLLAAAPVWGQGKTIKVGFVNHLTGDAAVYGQSMKKGTELAVDEVNLAWAKKGMKLEVVYEDDRLAAADAQTAFLKLAESDKVAVVMGSGSSTVTLSLCPGDPAEGPPLRRGYASEAARGDLLRMAGLTILDERRADRRV